MFIPPTQQVLSSENKALIADYLEIALKIVKRTQDKKMTHKQNIALNKDKDDKKN